MSSTVGNQFLSLVIIPIRVGYINNKKEETMPHDTDKAGERGNVNFTLCRYLMPGLACTFSLLIMMDGGKKEEKE